MKTPSELRAEDCPFSYPEGQEPAPIVHEVIGICAACDDDAHTEIDGRKLCFPCAYNEASLK